LQWREILGHARTRLGAAACSMALLDGEALRCVVAVGPPDGRGMRSAHPRLTPYQVKSVLRSVAAHVKMQM
jgi:hypothetical protein